jgi:betaine-aldehyde dehydrogenase
VSEAIDRGKGAHMDRDTFFIGGEWVPPAGTGTLPVVSPTTEAVIATVPDAMLADVDRAVAAARQAFDEGPWPRMTPAERADVMAVMSGALQARTDEIAHLITSEMGSPISFSTFGQALATTMLLDYYTALTREFTFEEQRDGAISSSIVRREAVGVVGAIVPWNIPLLCAMAKVAPELAAGCTIVLKPAPETPLSAYLLAEVAIDAGLPPGVLNIVQTGREVGEHIVTHPDVDKIAFTGSSVAGMRVAGLCGQQMKRCTLELGGKSAAIILDDADLSSVIPQLMASALLNNGEACVAQTRILAPRSRYEEVVDALAVAVASQQVGDPFDPSTTIGPLFARRHRERVEGYIAKGNNEGAKLVVGGGRPSGLDTGWYVEPTLFADVDNSTTAPRTVVLLSCSCDRRTAAACLPRAHTPEASAYCKAHSPAISTRLTVTDAIGQYPLHNRDEERARGCDRTHRRPGRRVLRPVHRRRSHVRRRSGPVLTDCAGSRTRTGDPRDLSRAHGTPARTARSRPAQVHGAVIRGHRPDPQRPADVLEPLLRPHARRRLRAHPERHGPPGAHGVPEGAATGVPTADRAVVG